MPLNTRRLNSEGRPALIVVLVLMFVLLAAQRDPAVRGTIKNAIDSGGAWLNMSARTIFTATFGVDLIKNAIIALLILVLGSAWRVIPKSWDRIRARRFWGEGVSSGGIAICFGSLIDTRLIDGSQSGPGYSKIYRDGRKINVSGPTESIVGLCEVRSASYLLNALAKFRRVPLGIDDDKTVLKHLDRSVISLGSAVSNEIAEIIERDSRNKFFSFDYTGSPAIRCKATDTPLSLGNSEVRRDYGLIVKIINTRFPKHFLILCAGLGEWGTSGAAWYLANHWRDLSRLGKEFGCVVEVEIGSDQSARIVYDYTDGISKRYSRNTSAKPA